MRGTSNRPNASDLICCISWCQFTDKMSQLKSFQLQNQRCHFHVPMFSNLILTRTTKIRIFQLLSPFHLVSTFRRHGTIRVETTERVEKAASLAAGRRDLEISTQTHSTNSTNYSLETGRQMSDTY